MSKPISGIRAGEQIVRCYDGFAIFVFCGKDSEIGWFVVDKLDRRYQYPEKPAYSTADNIRFCESIGDVEIWEEVRFSDVFNARTSFSARWWKRMCSKHGTMAGLRALATVSPR